MFTSLNRLVLAFAIVVIAQSSAAKDPHSRQGGCFSVVVGKNASADGWVIMAHNEDDYIPQVVIHHKVPRESYAPDAVVQLDNGGTIAQVPQTWSYIWSEMPGLLFSDSYLNEWGVCIASNACPSREDQPKLTDGGITSMLRKLVAQRAKSARQGVHIAGDFVRQFGYAASGRTYIISDPNEGWLFSVVNGQHWVAQRVPDDQVAIIANTYSVHKVRLADTVNYLGSTDIVEYAIIRQWYDPKTDGEFDFAKVYANPADAVDPRNIGRQWDGMRNAALNPPAYSETLPFAVIPEQKLGARDVMRLMRSHYEQTDLFAADLTTGCPHTNETTPICRQDTQTSFVAQLRGNMPGEIGLVYWVTLSSPCASCYIPFHFGLETFPKNYSGPSIQPDEAGYKELIAKPFEVDEANAFQTFTAFRHHIEQRYTDLGSVVRHAFDEVENGAFAHQPEVESAAMEELQKNRMKAVKFLTDYSQNTYAAAVNQMRQIQLTSQIQSDK